MLENYFRPSPAHNISCVLLFILPILIPNLKLCGYAGALTIVDCGVQLLSSAPFNTVPQLPCCYSGLTRPLVPDQFSAFLSSHLVALYGLVKILTTPNNLLC